MRRENAAAGAVDDFGFDCSGFEGGNELVAEHQGLGIFDIEPRRRAINFAHAINPVRMDEAGKAPFAAQDVGQQDAVLSGVFAVHLIVRAHDAGDAGIECMLEVRQVDFVQRALVDADVDGESRVLHRIERKMLDRRNHIMRLNASAQRGTHGPQMVAIFAVGFLRAPPGGMAQQVHADCARQRAALSARFDRHGFADAPFEIDVEARAARHRAGKGGRRIARHPTRTVGKVQRRQAEAIDPTPGAVGFGAPGLVGTIGRKESPPRHHADLFRQRGVSKDCLDPHGLLLECQPLGWQQISHWHSFPFRPVQHSVSAARRRRAPTVTEPPDRLSHRCENGQWRADIAA